MKVPTIQLEYNRIFLLSDVHFGVRSNSIEWLRNQESFFRDFYIPFLKENVKPGDILFLIGDWFDNRQLLDILVMNVSIDIVMEIAKILPIHFTTGNHDIYKKQDTDINSLRAFEGLNNVTVYIDPCIITNGKSKILVLPWIGDFKKEEDIAKANEADYVFAHTDMAFFQYDNNMKITNGVDLMSIKHFKRIISGHIHKRQEMDDGRGIYIGSPYHTKRSDIGNKKGVYILNPDNDEIEFQYNDVTPIFQRMNLQEVLELSLEEVKTKLNNNYTDIIIPEKYIHKFNLTRFIDLLENCAYKGLETKLDAAKLDNSLNLGNDDDNIKDILQLLEVSLNDSIENKEIISKLKELNKGYYDKASESEVINDLDL